MKNRISNKDLEYLSRLSKIKISKKDTRDLEEQLNKIIEYFNRLDDINTDTVPATYHVLELKDVLRKDSPTKSSPDKILSLAPRRKGRWIVAPRII